jgi:hypothetical protein
MVKDVSWKHVTIILGFFATIAVLTFAGQDTASFIIVGMAILAGVGVVAVKTTEAKDQTTQVKEQTNGNMTKMLEMLEAQGQLLAAMRPPSDDTKPFE